MENRRKFIKKVMMGLGAMTFPASTFAAVSPVRKPLQEKKQVVYRALGDTPGANLSAVINMMGGVERLVGEEDIVIIKPNIQWWNQGTPNLSAANALVELIMNHPKGFRGEVVFAENVHRGSKPGESSGSGWVQDYKRNSDVDNVYNCNDLCARLKEKYRDRFSVCHLVNVASGSRRVYSPEDGAGYVYCDGSGGVPLVQFDNGQSGDRYRSVIMTYPIMKTDRGTLVDFKNGRWENGSYTDQPVKFINLAALNHHSYYCGATSAVKNYLGISDLSGGPDPHDNGKLTKDYYNFHSFPFDKWTPGPVPGMIGAEIGVFLHAIRRADLNITTAEWVGLASRTEPPVARTRAVLASTDPVALDFHAFKYLLYPNSGIDFHNPEEESSPVYQYLKACAEQGGGMFDEKFVDIRSYDFRAGRMQRDDELVVKGDIAWGRDVKTLVKYFAFRTGLYKLMV